MFCFRRRKQSRPFLTYSEAQFTQLAEAKLYHYQQQQQQQQNQQQLMLKEESLKLGDSDLVHPKCDNIYVKMGDYNGGHLNSEKAEFLSR